MAKRTFKSHTGEVCVPGQFSEKAIEEWEASGPNYKRVWLSFGVQVDIREDGVVLSSNQRDLQDADPWVKLKCDNYTELCLDGKIAQIYPSGQRFESSGRIECCVEFVCDDEQAAYQPKQ
jgi:hypothetical protein